MPRRLHVAPHKTALLNLIKRYFLQAELIAVAVMALVPVGSAHWLGVATRVEESLLNRSPVACMST